MVESGEWRVERASEGGWERVEVGRRRVSERGRESGEEGDVGVVGESGRVGDGVWWRWGGSVGVW